MKRNLKAKDFWDFVDRTAQEVSTWPTWKKGHSVDNDDDIKFDEEDLAYIREAVLEGIREGMEPLKNWAMDLEERFRKLHDCVEELKRRRFAP